jgi:hypothetical protein
MKKILSVLLGVAVLSSAAYAKSEKMGREPSSIPERNVQVGGDANMDACGGYGIVIATTTLFKMSGGQYAFDKVEVNQKAFSCDFDEANGSVGIVFGKPNQDCKVSGPIEKKQEYKGPCKSGWIKKEFFELLAG